MIKPCTPLLPRCCCCCIYMLLLSIAITTTTSTTDNNNHHAATAVIESLPSLSQHARTSLPQSSPPLSLSATSTTSTPSISVAPSSSASIYSSKTVNINYDDNSGHLRKLRTRRKRVVHEEKLLTADDCLSSADSQSWQLHSPPHEEIVGNHQHHRRNHHQQKQKQQQHHRPTLVSNHLGEWRCEYKITIAVPDPTHVIQLNLTRFHTLADMRDFSAGNIKALQLQEKNTTTTNYHSTNIIDIDSTSSNNRSKNYNNNSISNNHSKSSAITKRKINTTDPATVSTTSAASRGKYPSTSKNNEDLDDASSDLNLPIESTKSSSSSVLQKNNKSSTSSRPTSSSSQSQKRNFQPRSNFSYPKNNNKNETSRSSVGEKDSKNSDDNVHIAKENTGVRSENNGDIVNKSDELGVTRRGSPLTPASPQKPASPSYGQPTISGSTQSRHSPVQDGHFPACRDNKLIIQEAGGLTQSKEAPLVVCLRSGGPAPSTESSPTTGAPVNSLVYHYQSSIQVTLIWDPHTFDSYLSLGYRMLPLEAVTCSHWCGESKSLCLLEDQVCDGYKDCVDGSDEDWEKCAVSTSPEQSRASTHEEDDSSHMVIIAVSVSVLMIVLMIPTALMIHFKCRSNQRHQRDSLLQQQQRTHSLSSEMYQSPSSSVQESSGSSHHQYDQQASLLQDQPQPHHHHQHELQQHQEQTDGTSNLLHHSYSSSSSSSPHQQHSLPTSCLEDEETASYTIQFSSLPERSLLDTQNQLHHYQHDHQQEQQQQQQRQQQRLSPYTPSDSVPQQTRESNTNNSNTNRRYEKELRHQSYPHHIAISRDGEEGFLASQRALHCSSHHALIHQVFRPPPNRTVYDRTNPPPPYSLTPPGTKSLDSVHPSKHGKGGNSNTNTGNVPLLRAGQSCEKRSTSCSSSPNFSSSSSSNNSNVVRNTKRQQAQVSPPQALGCQSMSCHQNTYRPISIHQQGQSRDQSMCPSPLDDVTNHASATASVARMAMCGPPPDYHQVASAFPPSIPPLLSPPSGACRSDGCGSDVGGSGRIPHSALVTSSNSSPLRHHLSDNVAAVAPVVTANAVSNNNNFNDYSNVFCCGDCGVKGGGHLVNYHQHHHHHHQNRHHHHQPQHQQQDAFSQLSAVSQMAATSISSPHRISSSLSPSSSASSSCREIVSNIVNQQQQQQQSSTSSKTVGDDNTAHPSSSSPSLSSNFACGNIVSTPPSYNSSASYSNNYPLSPPPQSSSYPPSHCTPPPPSYNDSPLIPMSPAPPQNTISTHHLHHQPHHQQQADLPNPSPPQIHQQPSHYSSTPPFGASSSSSSSTACPPNTNPTIPPDFSSNNVFIFTKSSPSVCPTPDNYVTTSSSSSSSSSSTTTTTSSPQQAPNNVTQFQDGSNNNVKPKSKSSLTPGSAPVTTHNMSDKKVDSCAVTTGTLLTSHQLQKQPNPHSTNSTFHSQGHDKNNKCNNIQHNSKHSGDVFYCNTLYNDDSTSPTTIVDNTITAAPCVVNVLSQAPTSSSLSTTTATSFTSTPLQSQQQQHHQPYQRHHPHKAHHHHQHTHPPPPQHQHHLSLSSTAQDSADQVISKMSLSSLPSPSSPFSLSSSSSSSLNPTPTSPFSPLPLPPPPPPPPSSSSLSPIQRDEDNFSSTPPSNFIKLMENENNNSGNLNVFHCHNHHHHHHHCNYSNNNNNNNQCCKAVDEGNNEMGFSQGNSDKISRGENSISKSLDSNGNASDIGVVSSTNKGICDQDNTAVGANNNVIHHQHHYKWTESTTTTTAPCLVVVGMDLDPCPDTMKTSTPAPCNVDNKITFDNNSDDKLCDDSTNDNNCNDMIMLSPSSSSLPSYCVNKHERDDIGDNSGNETSMLHRGDVKNALASSTLLSSSPSYRGDVVVSSSSSPSSPSLPSTMVTAGDNNIQQVHAAASVDKAKEH